MLALAWPLALYGIDKSGAPTVHGHHAGSDASATRLVCAVCCVAEAKAVKQSEKEAKQREKEVRSRQKRLEPSSHLPRSFLKPASKLPLTFLEPASKLPRPLLDSTLTLSPLAVEYSQERLKEKAALKEEKSVSNG